MSGFKPEVAVLARSKRFKACWSAFIVRQLNARGIHAWRVTPGHNPKYRPEDFKLVINYGTSHTPIWWDRLSPDCVVLNTPEQVGVSANKVKMFRAISELVPENCLEYFFDKDEAEEAIREGKTVIARTLLSSHSGRGIVMSPPDPLPDANLYTVLKRGPRLREYRVFMANGQFKDVVCKKRKGREKLLEMGVSPGEADTWWNNRMRQVVRCWDNGWAFCHNNLPMSDQRVFDEIALKTSRLLTWGCVDVLIDSSSKEWYMVEINSAPGLDAGNTQTSYLDSFEESALWLGVTKKEPVQLERALV